MSIFGFWGKYPYTDFHTTNLDYVFKTLDEHTKEIANLHETDDLILERVDGLDDSVRALGENVNNFSRTLATMKTTVDGHTSDIARLKNDVSGINSRVVNIDGMVTNIDSRVTNIETGESQISGRVAILESDVNTIKGEQTVQNNRISALEQGGGGGGGGGGTTVAVNPLITSGDNIADITVNGVVNHLYAKKYSTVTAQAKVATGTEIATITINGTKTSIKNGVDPASFGDKVAFTPVLTSGTEVGTITINGADQKIYAPAGGGGGFDGWTDGYLTANGSTMHFRYNINVGMAILDDMGNFGLGFISPQDATMHSVTDIDIPNGYQLRFTCDGASDTIITTSGQYNARATFKIGKDFNGNISQSVRCIGIPTPAMYFPNNESWQVVYGVIEPI